MKTYDYINRVVLTLLLSVYEGTWTHSPRSLLCITMILRVHRNFFEITTFPNNKEMFVSHGCDKEFVVKSFVDASFDTDLDDSKSRSRYILKVGAIS